MITRERRVNLENLDLDSMANLTIKLTSKLTEITDEAVEKANTLLNIYGMEAEMQIAIKEK